MHTYYYSLINDLFICYLFIYLFIYLFSLQCFFLGCRLTYVGKVVMEKYK